MRADSKFESLDGLTGVAKRRAWHRNRNRMLRAIGLTIRLRPSSRRHWPELDGLHGEARREKWQQLRRAELIRSGLTSKGTPRKTYRKWPQLAPHKPRSKPYNRCYMRLKRSLAADSRLGVMVKGFERGGTLAGRVKR